MMTDKEGNRTGLSSETRVCKKAFLLSFGGAFSLGLYFMLLSTSVALSQEPEEGKGRMLDTLFVYERYITKEKDVQAGAKVTKIAPELLDVYQSRSLAELLEGNTAIHIKSMGLGALATASFRGASPQQTRVNWNGVNITPVMAGIFDFSQMPVFFADKLSLYYGSNDVKSGTGAVGGSINISNAPEWDGRTVTTLSGEYGSYNTYTAKALVRYGTSRLSMKTRAYFQHSDNTFSYVNKVMGNEPFIERRRDADYSQFSAMQEVHFRINPRSVLSAVLWYQKGDRMLPQPLGVETTAHEDQKEDNFRAYLGWDFYGEKSRASVKAAYIFYAMKYGKWFDNPGFDPSGTRNSSHSAHLSGDYSRRLLPNLLLGTTLTYRHDIANAESYRDTNPDNWKIDDIDFTPPEVEAPLLRHRDILSWHNSIRWQALPWLLFDGRGMLETVDWKKPVATYSLGLVSSIIPERLSLRASASYNFRFPTLNELYWRPGGNPDVLPEEGRSFDTTLSGSLPFWEKWILSGEVSVYAMLIDNWILWLPTDESARGGGGSVGSGNQWLWRPQNKRDVLSSGAELTSKLEYKDRDFRGSLTFNYSYTDSHTRTKQTADDGSLLKQIPYVPRQKWSLRLDLSYLGAFLNFQTTYVGVRFITQDQSYFTYPYNVCNAQAGYTFRLGRVTLSPQLRADNLFNTYYESTQYYPMPRRNFLGSLLIKF